MIATPGKLKELMEIKEIEDILGFKHLEILIMGNRFILSFETND